jgi:translation initiation factor 2 gamma subunit (eIF-2gamma)
MTTMIVGAALITAALLLLAWAFPRLPRRYRR